MEIKIAVLIIIIVVIVACVVGSVYAIFVPAEDSEITIYSVTRDLEREHHEKENELAATVYYDEEIPPNSYAVEQTEHEQNYPESEKMARKPQDVKIHRADSTETNA